MFRALRVFAVLVVAVGLLVACSREHVVSQESYVFGTRVQVLVWGESTDKAQEAINVVLREFDRLHRTYHAWQPSDLTAVNAAFAAGRPIDVSEEMAALIGEAQSVARQGEFLFDPGIGKLVELWGFHDDTFKPRLPDAARLQSLRQSHPSIAEVEISGRHVSSRNRDVALDFGGYLKGVALDRAAEALRRQGIHNALINIGGNILALGSKGGVPWHVGIQNPRSSAPLASLDLRDGEAIGTSGDYQRFFELDGQRYCHLIDPRTGRPSTVSEAVTVLIPPGPKAGMLSDASSKPLFIAGDDWQRMAQRLELAQVLRVAPNGAIQLTDAMRARVHLEATATP